MPVSQNRSDGDPCAEHGDEALREHGRDDLVAAASDHHVERGRRALPLPPPLRMRSIVACAVSSTPSDATSDDSGEELRSGRKTTSLDDDAEDHRARQREDERDRGREPVRGQPQEQVRGHHRARTGGEVDDPGPAIGQHDAEADPGDEGARPQAEDCEEEDLVHQRSGAAAAATTRSFLRTVHSVSHEETEGTRGVRSGQRAGVPRSREPPDPRAGGGAGLLLRAARRVGHQPPRGRRPVHRRCCDVLEHVDLGEPRRPGGLPRPRPARRSWRRRSSAWTLPSTRRSARRGSGGSPAPAWRRSSRASRSWRSSSSRASRATAPATSCRRSASSSRPARSWRCSICPSATTRCSAACASTTSSSWTADAIRCPRRCATRCGSATPPPTSGCASWPTSAPRTRVTTSSRR